MTRTTSLHLALVLLTLAVSPGGAAGSSTRPVVGVPAVGSIEVAFSPDQGAEDLVIRVIDSARTELRGLAYSFTSSTITSAILRARRRHVDCALVVDEKENVEQDRSGKARSALSALVDAGCVVRVVSAFAIHHDKVLVVDRATVELGSFNYSSAAAHRNSENVLVNWGNPALAAVYLKHFTTNFGLAVPYRTRY